MNILWSTILLYFCIHPSYSQLQCLEPALNPGDPLGINYIGTLTTSTKGPCAIWKTAQGNINYLDSSQFPDISIDDSKNYCRNPKTTSGQYEKQPWCWLESNSKEYEFCDIVSCANICRQTYFGDTFKGTVSKTISNKICQNWASQAPHPHPFNANNWPIPGEKINDAGNNCRNPNNSTVGLWCYTMEADPVWEPCMAPICQSTRGCVNGTTPYSFKSLTRNEQYLDSCVAWSIIPRSYYNTSSSIPTFQSTSPTVIPIYHPGLLPDEQFSSADNFCRNPDNDQKGAWCYVANGNTFIKKYCKTPCTGIWACLFDRIGNYYQGIINVTESNQPCLNWVSKTNLYTDSAFPEKSVIDAKNYCRNPTNNPRGPWCWLASDPNNFGYCKIPICPQTPPLPPLTLDSTTPNPVSTAPIIRNTCRKTIKGTEYSGTINNAADSSPCIPWIQVKTVIYKDADFSDGSRTNSVNYCRNPIGSDSVGPFCFTSKNGPSVSRQSCVVPMCGTSVCRTTVEGYEYAGTQSQSKSGLPCISWTNINILSIEPALFPDQSLADSKNYCRNPSTGNPFDGPFCYTSPNTSESCGINYCQAQCRSSENGIEYSGIVNRAGNEQCIMWSDPRNLYYRDAAILSASNYCRNPNNDSLGPWCYTSSQTVSYCSLPACNPSTTCYHVNNSWTYSGNVNVTSTGRECLPWTEVKNAFIPSSFAPSFFPSLLPDKSIDDAKNYCRTPTNQTEYKGKPFCFLKEQYMINGSIPVFFEYCNVSICVPTPLSSIIPIPPGTIFIQTLFALSIAMMTFTLSAASMTVLKLKANVSSGNQQPVSNNINNLLPALPDSNNNFATVSQNVSGQSGKMLGMGQTGSIYANPDTLTAAEIGGSYYSNLSLNPQNPQAIYMANSNATSEIIFQPETKPEIMFIKNGFDKASNNNNGTNIVESKGAYNSQLNPQSQVGFNANGNMYGGNQMWTQGVLESNALGSVGNYGPSNAVGAMGGMAMVGGSNNGNMYGGNQMLVQEVIGSKNFGPSNAVGAMSGMAMVGGSNNGNMYGGNQMLAQEVIGSKNFGPSNAVGAMGGMAMVGGSNNGNMYGGNQMLAQEVIGSKNFESIGNYGPSNAIGVMSGMAMIGRSDNGIQANFQSQNSSGANAYNIGGSSFGGQNESTNMRHDNFLLAKSEKDGFGEVALRNQYQSANINQADSSRETVLNSNQSIGDAMATQMRSEATIVESEINVTIDQNALLNEDTASNYDIYEDAEFYSNHSILEDWNPYEI